MDWSLIQVLGQFDSGARLVCNSHPIIPAIPFEIEVAA